MPVHRKRQGDKSKYEIRWRLPAPPHRHRDGNPAPSAPGRPAARWAAIPADTQGPARRPPSPLGSAAFSGPADQPDWGALEVKRIAESAFKVSPIVFGEELRIVREEHDGRRFDLGLCCIVDLDLAPGLICRRMMSLFGRLEGTV